jgi:hypothetical protein
MGRGRASVPTLCQHVAIQVLAPQRQPRGVAAVAHCDGDVPAGVAECGLVRDGRRRHRVLHGQPRARAVQLRPRADALHWQPVREPCAEHSVLVQHGVWRRRVRHQLRASEGARRDARWLPKPVPIMSRFFIPNALRCFVSKCYVQLLCSLRSCYVIEIVAAVCSSVGILSGVHVVSCV